MIRCIYVNIYSEETEKEICEHSQFRTQEPRLSMESEGRKQSYGERKTGRLYCVALRCFYMDLLWRPAEGDPIRVD